MRILSRINYNSRHPLLCLRNFIGGRRSNHADPKSKSNAGPSPPSIASSVPVKRLPFYRTRLLPLGILTAVLGTAYIYHQSRDVANAEAEDTYTIALLDDIDSDNAKKPLSIRMCRLLPWRTLSRTSGWFSSLNLPHWTNQQLLSWFVRTYNINLEEAKESDLTKYKNLQELFSRELKDEVRPVHQISPLVSPCDGVIIRFNKINLKEESGQNIETAALPAEVKGVLYSVQTFLGIPKGDLDHDDEILRKELLACNSSSPESLATSLYCCILYLSPGDCHRFHSPVNWTLRFRRHCPGELLSVSPSFTKQLPEVFCLNERVTYTGQWEYGFFSMTAVGATNVGSIRVYHDRELATNTRRAGSQRLMPQDAWFVGDKYEPYHDAITNQQKFRIRSTLPLRFRKGDPFGQFNLGSTIVLLFQAPATFEPIFLRQIGKEIKYGESLL